MKDIYHNAHQVVAWLGPEADGSSQVMRLLNRIEFNQRLNLCHGDPLGFPKQADLIPLKKELFDFFSRSYWRRAWIIQEIAVASSVQFMCGWATAKWQGYEILLERLASDKHLLGTTVPIVQHLRISRSARTDARPIPLLQALYDSRWSLSTDPKDKVFALLGLSFDRELYLSAPSYSLSPVGMCILMTKNAIRARKSLDIIFTAGRGTPLSGQLPSWVSDFANFDTSKMLNNVCLYLSMQQERFRMGKLSRRWAATGDSVASFENTIIMQEGHLRIRGHRIGILNGLGATADQEALESIGSWGCSPSQKSNDRFQDDLSGALSLYSQAHHQLKCNGKMLDYIYNWDNTELYQTPSILRLGESIASVRGWRESNDEFRIRGRKMSRRALRTSLFGSRSLTGTLYRGGMLIVGTAAGFAYVGGHVGFDKHSPRMIEALESLKSLINEGLRFATTHEDDIGWVHPNTTLRDEIWLLEGCSMPAVLASTQKQGSPPSYRLVGHAYLYGYMDGAYWTSLRRDQLREIVIV